MASGYIGKVTTKIETHNTSPGTELCVEWTPEFEATMAGHPEPFNLSSAISTSVYYHIQSSNIGELHTMRQ